MGREENMTEEWNCAPRWRIFAPTLLAATLMLGGCGSGKTAGLLAPGPRAIGAMDGGKGNDSVNEPVGKNGAGTAGDELGPDTRVAGLQWNADRSAAARPGTDGRALTNGTSPSGRLAKPDEKPPESVKPAKGEKTVALTFDDGPDAKYTPAILDILQKYNVKATFFLVGTQVKKYPEIVQRIVDEGHRIGNHTFDHKDLTKLSKVQIREEIAQNDELIRGAVGFTPELVRAPYGAVDDRIKQIVKENGRKLVGWNVDTEDWAGRSVTRMRNNVKANTKDGSIILMHSFGGKNIANTVKLLPLVIHDLKKRGFVFVLVE